LKLGPNSVAWDSDAVTKFIDDRVRDAIGADTGSAK
jgi:predicted DNA-binding transcriptional regulator AlpA